MSSTAGGGLADAAHVTGWRVGRLTGFAPPSFPHAHPRVLITRHCAAQGSKTICLSVMCLLPTLAALHRRRRARAAISHCCTPLAATSRRCRGRGASGGGLLHSMRQSGPATTACLASTAETDASAARAVPGRRTRHGPLLLQARPSARLRAIAATGSLPAPPTRCSKRCQRWRRGRDAYRAEAGSESRRKGERVSVEAAWAPGSEREWVVYSMRGRAGASPADSR